MSSIEQHACVDTIRIPEYLLFSSKSVEVNGEEIQVNICMGRDYKCLLMGLGMAGVTSNHACIYCKIHTDDRRDMSKAHDFYCQEN